MTTTNRFYRVRVWSGEGTLADFLDPTVASNNLLVATSVRGGTNPYIPDHGEPKGDGQELDPLTGKTTVGAYTVRVLDVETGNANAIAAGDEFDADAETLNTNWPLDPPTHAWISVDGVPGTEGRSMRLTADSAQHGQKTWLTSRTFSGFAPDTEYAVSYFTALEGIGPPPAIIVAGQVVPAGEREWSGTMLSDELGRITFDMSIATPAGGYIMAFTIDRLRFYAIADAPGRLVTRVLADESAAWQLLSKQAVVEVSEDGTTWATQTAGYVNNLRLVDALEWELTIGDTRRTELQAELFRETPAPADDGSVLTTPSLLIGGPLWNGAEYATPVAAGGFGGITDYGPTRVTVIEQTGHSARQLDLNLVGGYWPPYYVNHFKDDEIYAINAYAREFFAHDDVTWAYDAGQDSSVYGWFPGLVVQLTRVSDGEVFHTHPLAVATRRSRSYPVLPNTDQPVGTVDNLVEKNVILRVDWPAALGTKPTAGEQFDVLVYPARPSERFPVHERGHPIALHTQKLTQAGIPYDAASAAAVEAAINTAWGGAVLAEVTWEKATPLAEYAETLQRFFGYATRLTAAGELEFFGVRVSPPTNATTITAAHLRDADTVIYEKDEDSIVTAVEVAAKSFTFRRAVESFEKGPGADEIPLDNLIQTDDVVEGAVDLAATTQTRTERFTLPGRVLVNGVPQAAPVYAGAIGDWVVNWRAEGVPEFELHCLPDVTAQVGDQVSVSLPHLPSARTSSYPRAARDNGPVACLVVRRTETPAGPDLKLLFAPPATQGTSTPVTGPTPGEASGLVPAFTLARSSADPARVATATLTNASDLASGDALVRWEYTVSATEPEGAGLSLGAPTDPATVTSVDTPAVAPESVVWMRARAVQAVGGAPLGAWSAWLSVTLSASAITVPAPALSWALDGSNNVDVTATLTAPATGVRIAAGTVGGAPPSLATIQAATLDSTDPFEAADVATLAAGEHVWIGAIAEDADGNESAPVYVRAWRAAVETIDDIAITGPFGVGDLLRVEDNGSGTLVIRRIARPDDWEAKQDSYVLGFLPSGLPGWREVVALTPEPAGFTADTTVVTADTTTHTADQTEH